MKKGFTLVELLAVIVILGLLIAITVPITMNVLNNARENTSQRQIENIEKASKNWFLKANVNLDNSSQSVVVTLARLLKDGYIEGNTVKSISTDKEMNGCVVIRYSSNQYSYKYKDSGCKCDSACICSDGICNLLYK